MSEYTFKPSGRMSSQLEFVYKPAFVCVKEPRLHLHLLLLSMRLCLLPLNPFIFELS